MDNLLLGLTKYNLCSTFLNDIIGRNATKSWLAIISTLKIIARSMVEFIGLHVRALNRTESFYC